MSAKTIRNALGLLQDDPDALAAWGELEEALGFSATDPARGVSNEAIERSEMNREELDKLLAAARQAHEMRREYDAVARLLALEVAIARGTPPAVELQRELARVYDEELHDDSRATAAFDVLLELAPDDDAALDALEAAEKRRSRWRDVVTRFVEEARAAGDAAFKSSLLVRAAEAAYRYGRPQLSEPAPIAALVEEIVSGLREAIEIDPKNRRAVQLLERVLRQEERYEELAQVLERYAIDASAKDEKIGGFVRLARVLTKKLKAPDRAVAAYERVLDLSPGHKEATTALVDHFTETERWDALIALYDDQLKKGGVRAGQEVGMLLQIAMVHWRMRSDATAAEPYFDRVRRTEPAHPGMLAFFREWCTAKGDTHRIGQILADAQRAMPDGPGRAQIAMELAMLAEDGANATKAIEQWRAILRNDAGNKEAREHLKKLYRQTAGWNALVDLLRSELERAPATETEERLALLREIASVYRDHTKSDTALVTVLTQIQALDPSDAHAAAELARVYETLGRWRDLLTTQVKLAELETDPGKKAELYRVVARRWLDQFSNVQNAVEAYEKLHGVLPGDEEAVAKLHELYTKRRAFKPLYELLASQVAHVDGARRRELWLEMAKLAAERLDRGADAVRLYKLVIAEDPTALGALDALEKQAERDKDFATQAEVLERRVDLAHDDTARLAMLQKLGAVYADRLHDHAGTMRTWRRVLDLAPGNAKALRVLRDGFLAVSDFDGLRDLYAATGDFEGLVEVFSTAADKATDPTIKVDLSFRAADVFAQKLNAPERAFRAYERVLSVQPEDRRAASSLIPIYEREEKWARLPALYEVLLGHAETIDDKLALLAKLGEVTGQRLGDRAAAFGYARRAYEIAPDHDGALAQFEASARMASKWDAFVAALTARLTEPSLGPALRHELRSKLAAVEAQELGQLDAAIAIYKELIEENDKDEAAVQELDRILRSKGRHDSLRWLFGLRVDRANTALKLELLNEWAQLEEDAFGAPDEAIRIHRKILELVPKHGGALRALARLLRDAGDAQGAVEVLERDRDQREGTERAAREVEIAKLLLEPLKRARESLAAAQRALELVANHPGAIEVVEALVNVRETRAESATILDAAYDVAGQWERQVGALEVLIATAPTKNDRLAFHARLADVLEYKLGDHRRCFDATVRAAGEFPAELALWDRLAFLAARIGGSAALADALTAALPPTGDTDLSPAVELDLAERAATLFEDKLADPDRAQPYLERILSRNPGNESAFARLKQILSTREQWGELEAAYERTIAATEDSARSAELLSEIALVAEEITGDRPKAIGFYERILVIDAIHEQAIRALDSLYAAEARWESLAALIQKRLDLATEGEAKELELRLGTLYASRLGKPEIALDYLERVLSKDGKSNGARDLVEQLLGTTELRARAASVLEHVYVARDDVADLVRVLGIRLEFELERGARRVLLGRIAELRDERLNDERGAFDTFAQLLPLDPDDARARDRLLSLGRTLGAHDEAVRVLRETARVANAPQPRAELLSEVAAIQEISLGDHAAAEATYRDVLAIDENDASIALPAARALERLLAAAGKSVELGEMLRIQVRLEPDGQVRRELLGRLGELCETVLEDAPGAIAAWRSRLDDEPGDEQALLALDRLYTRTDNHRALVEVLRAREQRTQDGPTRRELLLRIAAVLAQKLTDVDESILAYRTVLDDFGPDRAVLAAVGELYELADRWQDLAEALDVELSLAEEPDDRLVLLAKLGDVRQRRLGDVTAAIDTYRQALTLDPSHAPSRDALEKLLENADARREAASMLRPLYEADGEHARLLHVLDIQAELAETIDEKLATLSQAAHVAEGPLAEPKRAFDYVARGLREAVAEPELTVWTARAEQLAASIGSFAELVALFRDVLPAIADSEVQLDVALKIADLGRSRLDDRALARDYYVKALEIRGDDRRALLALELLYDDSGDAAALLDVLKRRVETAESDDERKALLYKQARLCDEALSDRTAAIAVYEQVLELALEEPAVATLTRLYGATERWGDLIALYERQLGTGTLSEDRKAELHHRLGEVLEKRVSDHARAFDEYAAALELDPQHAATVAALEALMGDPAHAARAAEMLESVYLARLDWRRVMGTIEARLAASEDPEDRRQLLRRLAKLHEEQEEDYTAALETTATLFAEDIADETTWAELERLARVSTSEKRLAEIFAAELDKVQTDEAATARLAVRTAELFNAQDDTDRALAFYRRAYAFAPDEQATSFAAIDRLLGAAGRSAERVALYREALEYRNEPTERIATLHTIAQIQEAELHDDAAAIDTYRAALDVDETDGPTLEALARLFERTERWRDLADLTRRRGEQSALPDDEARFRIALGKLLDDKLGERGAAIDEYESVLELTQGGPDALAQTAVAALEALLADAAHKERVIELLRPVYERADDWKKLVGLNEERLSIATGRSDRVALLGETARLWETRGGDRDRAFDALVEAFVLDPEEGATRAEVDRLAEETSRWDDLAACYEKGTEHLDGAVKIELLTALARLHDKRRDDPRQALVAWERVFRIDETELVPLEEMDALATLLSDWVTLVRVLAKKTELLLSDEDRARTWRRIGEARRDMLDDAAGAVDAYEQALSIEPDSAFTLDNLIDLYEAKNDAARLVDLYGRRIELCGEDDDDLRYRLLVDAANRYELGLHDQREAIARLSDALALRPGDEAVVKRLGALYEAEHLWPELLSNLRLQAASASSEADQRALKRRIGQLLAGELDDPAQALDAYRDVLAGGFDEEAAKAVRDIGEARDELRAEAADILEPVLRSAARHEELVPILELRLRAQTEPGDRAGTLRAIARVIEESVGDAPRAQAALLRALAEEPGDAQLHGDIERLAERVGKDGWARYADALAERAASTFDAVLTTDLYCRVGNIAEEKLGDDARAAKAYVKAAEQSGDAAGILVPLDRLYGRLGDAHALAVVLDRRVAIETDPSAQAELYHRLASLQIKEFGERAQGLSTLRQALERQPDHTSSREAIEGLLDDDTLFDEAFEALEWVYRTIGQSENLGELYARRVRRAESPRDRIRARLELARVLEELVHDLRRAQRTLEDGLSDDPTDVDTLAELERVAALTNGFGDAANALARALDAATELPAKVRAEQWVRAAGWRRDKLSDAPAAEAAFLKALELDPDDLETLQAIEGLQRAPGRERDLVATLRRRAKLETELDAKRTLLREAKVLAETTVGDTALAEALLRELLVEDEGDLYALEELTRLREAPGDFAEVVTLLLRRAELVTDGAEVLALRHRAAHVVDEKLGDRARAITLYEEIYEQEPTDAQAAARLRELYVGEKRPRDLGKLLLQLIDMAESAAARAALRLELARLQDTEFGEPRDAADTLRAILEEDPTHGDAVVALSQILEKTGQDEELAELLNSQIERARERGDAAVELTLQVRLGEVFEGRLRDAARALATYEAVLERDPAHAGALNAVARLCEARANFGRAAEVLATLVGQASGADGVALALRLADARTELADRAGACEALRTALGFDRTSAEVRARLRATYEKEKNWGELAELLVGDADLLESAHPVAAEPPKAQPGASIPPPPAGPLGDELKLLRRAAEIHLKERNAPGEAIPILERASALVPYDRELLLVLCDAYNAAQRERDAATVLERIIASFGTKRTKELALYHHRLGRALGGLGDKAAALAQLDLAFKIDPGSIAVLRELGGLAFEAGDLERAQKTFRALLLQKLDGNAGITKGEVFFYLGEISLKQDDKTKAVQMFERAVENEPSLARAKARIAELKG